MHFTFLSSWKFFLHIFYRFIVESIVHCGVTDLKWEWNYKKKKNSDKFYWNIKNVSDSIQKIRNNSVLRCFSLCLIIGTDTNLVQSIWFLHNAFTINRLYFVCLLKALFVVFIVTIPAKFWINRIRWFLIGMENSVHLFVYLTTEQFNFVFHLKREMVCFFVHSP